MIIFELSGFYCLGMFEGICRIARGCWLAESAMKLLVFLNTLNPPLEWFGIEVPLDPNA